MLISVTWATFLSLNNYCDQVDEVSRPGPGHKLTLGRQGLP